VAEQREKRALAQAALGAGSGKARGGGRVAGLRIAIATLSRRQTVGFAIVAVYVALVVANFVFMSPVLVGQPITQLAWQNHQWLPSWT
ncbi:MAG TPA: hypothetical protein K8V11_10020, partial [Dietzia timorensis]|nr:hypothetical protein [Dietzia timorensis]